MRSTGFIFANIRPSQNPKAKFYDFSDLTVHSNLKFRELSCNSDPEMPNDSWSEMCFRRNKSSTQISLSKTTTVDCVNAVERDQQTVIWSFTLQGLGAWAIKARLGPLHNEHALTFSLIKNWRRRSAEGTISLCNIVPSGRPLPSPLAEFTASLPKGKHFIECKVLRWHFCIAKVSRCGILDDGLGVKNSIFVQAHMLWTSGWSPKDLLFHMNCLHSYKMLLVSISTIKSL
jgi:hypothetical protein